MQESSLLNRFLNYVKIDTKSDPDSATYPSSPGQWDLLKLLESELQKLGAAEVELDQHGYLTASIPANSSKKMPTLAFFAHVDTAPDYSGRDVKPLVHQNYNGTVIELPYDGIRLDPKEIPALAEKLGETIITTSGDTLLGADDKSGVAVLMTFVERLLSDTSIKHGPLKFCFNPDEEIGKGVVHLDLKKLGADFAYTLDAGELGRYNFESFSADQAIIKFKGVAIHPGDAKGRMVNALHMAAKFVTSLPREIMCPETTENFEGYIHPLFINGNPAETELRIILRDFELEGLQAKGNMLQKLCEAFQVSEPRSQIHCEIQKQYRNMRYWLEDDMRPVELAVQAIEALGITPLNTPIRGGTDGSVLTERGLPTPNLFNGPHCCHGPQEWVSLQDMEKSVELCVKLVELWEQQA